MSITAPPRPRTAVFATSAHCDDEMLHVELSDGREISVPLEWFPRLRDAAPEQRENWELIGPGIGLHWPDVDEDISVRFLLEQ